MLVNTLSTDDGDRLPSPLCVRSKGESLDGVCVGDCFRFLFGKSNL